MEAAVASSADVGKPEALCGHSENASLLGTWPYVRISYSTERFTSRSLLETPH